MKQLTEKEAIELANSNFWEDMSYEERAKFQINQSLLCMPFDIFHEAMEKTLNRPIWTHEFGLNYEGLKNELNGGKSPTMEEILNMIPEDKRLIILTN